MTAVKQAKVAKTHAGGETRVYHGGGATRPAGRHEGHVVEMTTNGGNSGILQAMRAKKQKLDRSGRGREGRTGRGMGGGNQRGCLKPLCSLMAYFPSL